MRRQVQQWGNSLAVRIPKPFAEETGLKKSSEVDISVIDGKLVLVPIKEPGENLESLLARITDENLHEEIDFGPPVGKELL